MLAIYKKELRSFFNNMTGYIFIAFILVIAGIYTAANCLKGMSPDFEFVLASLSFVLLLCVPILTMRSLAEERRSKTDQLLYSLPMKVSAVVLGKYLAMLTVFLIPTGVMMLYPFILAMFGSVPFLTIYSAFIGFILLGAALIAVGMFMSALTESQLISAVISFASLLVIYLMSSLASMVPTTALASLLCFTALILVIAFIVYSMTHDVYAAISAGAILEIILLAVFIFKRTALEGAFPNVMRSLAMFDRFNNFALGIFDVTAIIYYLTVVVVFVFLSIQAVEKRRWI